MELSGRIKTARQHMAQTLGRKISQKELGRLCGGWSQNRISNYEAGTRTASAADCLVIAKTTGVRIEWLQLESGPMLQSGILEQVNAYDIKPPVIDWDEVNDFIDNPSSIDLLTKAISPFSVIDKKAFAVVLPHQSQLKYMRPKTAVVTPIVEGEKSTNCT